LRISFKLRTTVRDVNSRKGEVCGASHAVYVSSPKEVAVLIEEAVSHAFEPPGDSPRILGDSEVIQLRIVRISYREVGMAAGIRKKVPRDDSSMLARFWVPIW
jgi:hypothetical protein